MTTTTDLRCFIGATDYGPLSENRLRSLQTTPSGPEQIGLAAIGLGAAGGGGYSIVNRQEVQCYEWTSTNHNPSVGYISAIYYGGFVNLPDTGRQAGSTDKTWTVQAQDYNLLKKRLVSKAAASQAIHLAAGHFDTQVASLFSQLGGGSALIDASSQVANLSGTATLPAQTFAGLSVEKMLAALCKAAIAANAALAPRVMIAPDYTTGPTRTSWGLPVLYIWDANAPPVAVMTLSDATPGDILAVGYSRKLDSTDQVTARQSIRPTTGYVATATNAAAISTWPNPYDADGAWWDEPIADTTSTSNAEADAALQAQVDSVADPRETITLTTQRTPPPLPGQYVTLSLTLEGIASGLYLVAGVSISYGPYLKPDGSVGLLLTTQLQLGLARLLLGQDPGALGGGTRPQIAVPPDVPSGLTCTSTFDPYQGNAVNAYSWTLPSNLAGIVGYAVYETTGGLTYRNYVAGASVTNLAIHDNPNQAFSTVVHAVGSNGLESVDSNIFSFTSTAQYTPDPPTALHVTASGIDANGKGWARVGFTAPGTTHGPHDLYDFRRVTGSQEIHVSVPGASTEAVFSNLTPEVTYTVTGRTLSLPSWYGAYSSPISVRVTATRPPPNLSGGGAPAVDQPLFPYAQSAGTASFSVATTGGMDGAACYSVTTAGSDAPALTGVAFDTRAGQAWAVRSAAQKSGGSPTWTGAVEWDDGSDTWAIPSSTLTLPSPGTSWPGDYTEQQVIAPPGALRGRLRYIVTTVAALTILLSIPSPAPAKTDADLNLATLTFRHPTTGAALTTATADLTSGALTFESFDPSSMGDTPLVGRSTNGVGVTGVSTNNYGVDGQSVNGSGVHGNSDGSGGAGVLGENTSGGLGVSGIADTGAGVQGRSDSGYGVAGTSSSGASAFFQAALGTNTAGTVIIQQRGSSTANLLEFRDSSGTLLSHVDYLGVWHTP